MLPDGPGSLKGEGLKYEEKMNFEYFQTLAADCGLPVDTEAN